MSSPLDGWNYKRHCFGPSMFQSPVLKSLQRLSSPAVTSSCCPGISTTSLTGSTCPLSVFYIWPSRGSIKCMSPTVVAAISLFASFCENNSRETPPNSPITTFILMAKSFKSQMKMLVSMPAEAAIGSVLEKTIASHESACFAMQPSICPVMYCVAKTFPPASPERASGFS